MTPSHQPLIAAEGLTRSFGSPRTGDRVEVLRGIDVTIPRGTMLAVVGPSGCGKTSLLYCLSGLDRPDGGRLRGFGADMASMPSSKLAELYRTRIGFVFQSSNLVESLTAEENVLLPDRLRGRRVDASRAASILAAGAVSTGSSAFAAKPGAAIDSAFNAILGSGVLAVGAVAAGAPWVFPRVNALLGRAVPATASPAWFAACRQSSAYPKRTTRAALPFFAGAGVAGLFTGMIGTWQRAIDASGQAERLNTVDTVICLTPPVAIGLVGTACQMLLSRRQRIADFASLRVAGASRRTVLGAAVGEAALTSATVFLLSTGFTLLVSTMTARALSATGLPAEGSLVWPPLAAVVASGFAAAAAVNVSAALRANRGNPRGLLARE
ncbi:MAG: ATP-binding cassette domain-containing protein [Peptidiphaga sp.]